jgi:predicted porin
MLSPVLSLQASVNFDDFDSSRDTDLDSRAYSGQLGGQYVLNSRTSLGISGAVRHRESSGNDRQYTTDTDIWDVAASISRQLSPTMSMSLQAGPSFVSTKQIPPSSDSSLSNEYSSDISYFASADVVKEWQRARFGVSYTRSESRGGGTSSSAFVDNIALNVNYYFSRQWKLRIYGGWTQRKEISSIPGSAKVDTTNYQAVGTVAHRITPRLSLIGQYAFLNQDQDGGPGTVSIGQVHTGYLALRYTFDPIAF